MSGMVNYHATHSIIRISFVHGSLSVPITLRHFASPLLFSHCLCKRYDSATTLPRGLRRLRFGCCDRRCSLHKPADLIRRALLHLVGHMRVSIQRKACTVMPQHAGQSLGVHAALHGEGGKCVPKVVEPHAGVNSCRRQQLMEAQEMDDDEPEQGSLFDLKWW